MVQYTVEECDKDFHGRSPIWGRPYVEGIILCNQLNLRGLCVIEILEHPETKQPIPSFHWVNQESYTTISEREAKEKMSNLEIPTLVVEQNSLHFVPLLPASLILGSAAATPPVKEMSLHSSHSDSDWMRRIFKSPAAEAASSSQYKLHEMLKKFKLSSETQNPTIDLALQQ